MLTGICWEKGGTTEQPAGKARQAASLNKKVLFGVIFKGLRALSWGLFTVEY